MSSGTGTCTVAYDQSGNGNYNAATQVTESVTASKAGSSTVVSSSMNPSDLGQEVTFTATVTSGAGTPSGTVQFKDGGNNLGTATSLVSGQAQLATSSLGAGTHTITADYSGDSNFSTSSGTLSGNQVVHSAQIAIEQPPGTDLTTGSMVDFGGVAPNGTMRAPSRSATMARPT